MKELSIYFKSLFCKQKTADLVDIEMLEATRRNSNTKKGKGEKNNEPVAYENTDKEIWREIPDDYYAPSIFVTAQNTIGINVGGSVHVKHVHEWHRLAHPIKEPTDEEILHQNLIWGQQNGEDYSMLTVEDIKPLISLIKAILRKASEK